MENEKNGKCIRENWHIFAISLQSFQFYQNYTLHLRVASVPFLFVEDVHCTFKQILWNLGRMQHTFINEVKYYIDSNFGRWFEWFNKRWNWKLDVNELLGKWNNSVVRFSQHHKLANLERSQLISRSIFRWETSPLWKLYTAQFKLD